MPFVDDIPKQSLFAPLDTPEGYAVTPRPGDEDKGPNAVIRAAEAFHAGPAPVPAMQTIVDKAFDQDNVGRNILRRAFGDLSDPVAQENDPTFKGFDNIKGTTYEKHWPSFADAPQNSNSYEAMKRKIDKEEEGRRILDAAPWYQSVPAQLLAGGVDLPTLLPGGAFYRGAKGGFSVLQSGASVGAWAGASSLAQEAALHAMQETRTVGESAVNVGASVFLGGLLGAGGAKLLTNAEWNGAVRALERELISGGPVQPAAVRPIYDDVVRQLTAVGREDGEAASVGAVVAARYGVLAERIGVDPVELYRGQGIEVRAGDVGETALREAAQFEQRSRLPMDEQSRMARATEMGFEDGWFHGAERTDRLTEKGQLNPKRATSGPMPFFTKDPEMASSYAKGKPDTSRISEDMGDVASYFTVSPKDLGIGGRTPITVERSWNFLPADVKQTIRDRAKRIGYQNPDEATGPIILHPEGVDATLSSSHYDWVLKNEARGNPLAALREMWLDGGNLVGSESELAHIFRLAGYPHAISEAAAPWTEAKGVMPVMLRIQRPLTTSNIQEIVDKVIPALEEAFKRDRTRKKEFGSDMWHKDYRFTPREWVAELRREIEGGESLHVFTSIPDKVTEQLKRLGYDGIIDAGGKGGGVQHAVAIPFEPKQVRSRFARFDPEQADSPKLLAQNPAGWGSVEGGATGGHPKGKISFEDNKAIITLFGTADKSTFVHEAGHLWLKEMVDFADRSPSIKADLDATLKWFGVDDVSKIGRKQHEQWARGFEEYLREGKAPSSKLAAAFENFRNWLTAIYRSIADFHTDHVAITDDIRGVMDRMLATDAEIAARQAGNTSVPGSVGAAANSATSLADNTIAGKMAGGVAAATQKLNPLLRALHSPSATYRDIALNLFKNPLYLKQNDRFSASAMSAEDFAGLWNANLAKAIQADATIFPDYKKAGGQLSKTEFFEEVGRAMRRNDTHGDPFITKAAKVWRTEVMDPLKKAAIDAGLLDKDVAVTTAQSYFHRMWNRQKIIAKEGEFRNIIQQWVEANMPTWAKAYDDGVERKLNPLRREIEDLEMTKLRRGEEVKQRGEEIEAGEFREADIRSALRIVEGGAPKPKGVKTLTQFIHGEGGLVDFSGELAHMGINNRSRPGFVRSQRARIQGDGGGWAIDDMARHAWEKGYFPEHLNDRPSVREFLEALSDDFNKHRAVVRAQDRDAFRLNELIDQLEADLSRVGARTGQATRFATSDEVKGIVDRVYKAMDAEADRKVAALKSKLVEREAEARIEREARFVGDPRNMGRTIADEVIGALTGKTVEGPRPENITIKARGPLAERTFNIPDHLVEDFLESNVEDVGRRYVRVMSADVELARKFGSVDMVEQIAKIREDYANMRAVAETEAARLKLDKQEKSDIFDLTAMRDQLRGVDPGSPADGNYARIVRATNHVNYLRVMGEVAFASLSETVRPAMVHGLLPFMDTIGQLMTNLKGMKMSVAEAQQAGNVLERVLGHRLATMAEIGDPYASRGAVEAFLENMTNFASKWNGIRLLTDMQKSLSSVMTQNRILRNVTNYEGAKAVDKRYLAYLGIDQSMAERIAAQFAEHGETVDRVRVAHTDNWTDDVARRAYRVAMNQDIDSIITTKGIADVPIFASTPTGKMMLQFKSFAMASHQRVLLRGLQEDQTRFLGGTIAMSAIGMAVTYLKAVSGNRPETQEKMLNNPGWWVGEGLDRSGILSVPMELANTFEKPTGFNPIKAPFQMFDSKRGMSQKNQNRNDAGSFAGPTAGMIGDALSVAGIPKGYMENGEVTKGQKNAATRLLPFNSYFGIRQLLNYTVNPPQ